MTDPFAELYRRLQPHVERSIELQREIARQHARLWLERHGHIRVIEEDEPTPT